MQNRLKFLFVSLLWFALAGIGSGAAEEAKVPTVSQLPQKTIVIEAESAIEKEDGVAVIKKAGASAGEAVICRPLAKAYYDVDLPDAGTWYVWVRMFCPGGESDSCWVGMDNVVPNPPDDARNGDVAVKLFTSPEESVNNAKSYMVWYWDAGKAKTDPKSYFAVNKPGKTRVWLKGRESGVIIDTIILTPDQEFNPEVALKGGPITPSSYQEPEVQKPFVSNAVKLEKPLKVLFIGNSFTFAVPKTLNKLVPDIQTDLVAFGGFSLEQHWKKGEAVQAIQKTKWDFVVLQDQSHGPLLAAQSTCKYLRLFNNEIQKNGARTVLFMTHPCTKEYFEENQHPAKTIYQMMDRNKAVYEKMGKELKAKVAPVGLVWCNYAGIATKRIAKDYKQLYSYDGLHASDVGTYLTACVFYSAITGRNPKELPDLDIQDAKGIKQTVWEAVKDYPLQK